MPSNEIIESNCVSGKNTCPTLSLQIPLKKRKETSPRSLDRPVEKCWAEAKPERSPAVFAPMTCTHVNDRVLVLDVESVVGDGDDGFVRLAEIFHPFPLKNRERHLEEHTAARHEFRGSDVRRRSGLITTGKKHLQKPHFETPPAYRGFKTQK